MVQSGPVCNKSQSGCRESNYWTAISWIPDERNSFRHSVRELLYNVVLSHSVTVGSCFVVKNDSAAYSLTTPWKSLEQYRGLVVAANNVDWTLDAKTFDAGILDYDAKWPPVSDKVCAAGLIYEISGQDRRRELHSIYSFRGPQCRMSQDFLQNDGNSDGQTE
jgi:hypothetical protein